MSRRSPVVVRPLFSAMLVAAGWGHLAPDVASAYGPSPTAPYRTDADFWQTVKTLQQPSETSTSATATRVRTGLWEAEKAGRLMPKLAALSRINLAASAFSTGWLIGRFIDNRWLHLSGNIGTTAPAPGSYQAYVAWWEWRSDGVTRPDGTRTLSSRPPHT